MIPKTTLLAAIKTILATILLRVTSVLDRGVDSVLGEFAKLDARLERHIEGQKSKLSSLAAARDASRARENAVYDREFAFRAQTFKAADVAVASKTRAERVRKRISTLLD